MSTSASSGAGQRPEVKIMGSGSSSGGEYGNVKVMGEAVFYGDTVCELFKCSGTAEVRGNLRAEDVKVMGTLILGSKNPGDSLTSESSPPSNLQAEYLKVTGEIEVPGDCSAEDLIVKGSVRVAGMLSGEEINIRLYGASSAREICGSRITIKGKGALTDMFNAGPKKITTELIEGDTIYLENTEAEIVRGARVEIGPGCRIGLVEYKESCELGRESSVAEQRRIL